MRKSGFSVLSLVAGLCLSPAAAFAQDAPAPAPAPATAPAPPPAVAEPDHAAPPGVAPVPDSAAAPAPTPPTAEITPAPAPAEAAPAAPTFPVTTITGGIEGSYGRMLSAPHNADTAAPTRAYDSTNGFLLNQASFGLKHQLNEYVYGQIRFDAGANAGINSFGTSRLFDVREAYAVATGMGLTFTAGKFTTYQGIEVVDGWLNPTITRGYLYYLAEPVTHVGAKLHYTAGAFDIGAGVVNGWDTNNGYFATGDNNPMKTLIWRLGYTSPAFWAGFSGTYGVEKANSSSDPRLSLDLTGAATVSPMLTINFQGNYGSEKKTNVMDPSKTGKWVGFGIQPVVKLDAFQVGLRFEYLSDDGLSRTGSFVNPADPTTGDLANTYDKVSLWTFGIAPGYTIASALLLRAEFRVDGADKEVLWNGKKTQTSLGLSAAYYF
jgi:hypothetical protein